MSSPYAGSVTTYDLTVGTIVNMDEAIFTLDPLDIPLLGGIGSDGYPVLGAQPVDQIHFYWQHESLLVPRCDTTRLSTTGETSLGLATGDKYRFSTNDVVRIARVGATTSELVKVTGYSVTTATEIVVTRAFGSTTATTINTSDSLIGVGSALIEGATPENARSRDRTTVDNYTQIFGPIKIDMTGTEQVVPRYGVANEWQRQLRNRMAEQAVAREMAYIYGKATNDSSAKIRTTGGILSFLSTNVNYTLTQLTVANIVTMMQTSYNQGGIPNLLVANPLALTDLDDLSNTSILRTTIDDPRRGRVPVMEVHHEYGSTTILRHRWLYKQNAFAYRVGQAVRRTLRPMQFTRLAKTADSDQAMFLVEEGLEFKGQQQAWALMGLTSY